MDFHRASMPYPKAMAYTNYNDDQVLFIDALFLVTLLDCAGHYDHVDNQLTCVKIAKAFAYVRYLFEHSDPGDFDNAFSISFIRQYRLDTPQGMMDYIANHSPPTSTKLPTSTLTGRHREYYFPYSIDLHNADDKKCGGMEYLRGMEEHHIHVRRFTRAERNMFLRFYAESIPKSFHDDLAVLTLDLISNVWHRTIQPQAVCCLPNGMEAVNKLTKEYNAWKREIIKDEDDQVLFIDALFLVTLFDCAGHYDHVDNQLTCVEIAKAFAYVRQIFEHSDPEEFDNAFPSPLSANTVSTLLKREYYFPYSIDLHKADDRKCGGVEYLRGMEEHHIHVRRFTGAEVNMFLRFYAESIPKSFHDDLAVLTEKLRLDIWCRMIRSQTVCCLPNGMEAVTRLTKEYNFWKRAANRRRPMDEPNQLPPIDQQFQAETWKRKVTNGALENELRDGLKDDLESVLLNGLVGNLTDFNVATVEEVDKHRQQQRQSQETEKLAQRNTAITEYMDKLRVTQTATPHRRNEVQAIRQAVERRLREHYRNYSIEVHLFGSFASGLCSMSSDADMTVYNLHVASPHCPPIVELAASLRRIGYQRVTSIPHARVPIASWKLYGIQCDANLNQPLGVHNSKLISTYSKIDDRFKTLWFSIKQIGLQHGIISASTGFLSSYALTMMLVVFLQDITSPTILPRLQQSPHATLHTIDGYDCSFDSKTNYTSYGANNTNSAGQLLIDFFYFYGYVFDYANQEVHPSLGKIQNRSITPPARSRTDSRPKDWPICILDPFITDRNVAGNCGKEKVAKVQTCFQSAYHALQAKDINKAFCV